MFMIGESVTFMCVGVIEEDLTFFLQRPHELCRLVWRHLWVLLSVHNQEWSLDPGHIKQDIRLAIDGWLLFRCSTHLRFPPNDGVAIGAFQERGAGGDSEQANCRRKRVGELGDGKAHHGSSLAASADRNPFGIGETLVNQVLSRSANICNLFPA